jgi:hypothetical protein
MNNEAAMLPALYVARMAVAEFGRPRQAQNVVIEIAGRRTHLVAAAAVREAHSQQGNTHRLKKLHAQQVTAGAAGFANTAPPVTHSGDAIL